MGTANVSASAIAQVRAAHKLSEIRINLTPFDQKHYLRLIEARAETLQRVVKQLKHELSLTS